MEEKYRPLSPWAYLGYSLLFCVPVVGFVFLMIFSFNTRNINRRNFARSFFCGAVFWILVLIISIFISIFVFDLDLIQLFNRIK